MLLGMEWSLEVELIIQSCGLLKSAERVPRLTYAKFKY